MQKTKLISKDFIREYGNHRQRERRDNTVYNLPIDHQHQKLPSIDCHYIYTTQEETYSIEEFIHNLQNQQFIYFNEEYCQDFQNHQESLTTRPIDRINIEYLEKMGDISDKEGNQERTIRFNEEIRVKYFNQSDAPEVIQTTVEYENLMTELNEECNNGRFQQN